MGKGSYGEVIEVKELNEFKQNKSFAIKGIELKMNEQLNEDINFNETILKELENFSVIKGLFNLNVVTYYDLWNNKITKCQKCNSICVHSNGIMRQNIEWLNKRNKKR